MSSFVTDLWESIFTPGPTPSIIIATNVSFGALQLVLLGMLFATRSIHFLVLAVLCAGLWWAINWFAAEVKIAQELERQQRGMDEKAKAGEAAADARDGGEEGEREQQQEVKKSQVEVLAEGSSGEVKRRGLPEGKTMASSVSTEDEWEKVSEGEKDK